MLTPEEATIARAQGWAVCEVWDSKTKRLQPAVLPTEFKAPFKNARQTLSFVVQQAKMNDRVALKALRLVTQGRT